jgi:hypothetical protein
LPENEKVLAFLGKGVAPIPPLAMASERNIGRVDKRGLARTVIDDDIRGRCPGGKSMVRLDISNASGVTSEQESTWAEFAADRYRLFSPILTTYEFDLPKRRASSW